MSPFTRPSIIHSAGDSTGFQQPGRMAVSHSTVSIDLVSRQNFSDMFGRQCIWWKCKSSTFWWVHTCKMRRPVIWRLDTFRTTARQKYWGQAKCPEPSSLNQHKYISLWAVCLSAQHLGVVPQSHCQRKRWQCTLVPNCWYNNLTFLYVAS